MSASRARGAWCAFGLAVAAATVAAALGAAGPAAAGTPVEPSTGSPAPSSSFWSMINHPAPPGLDDFPLRGLWVHGPEVWAVGYGYADLFWKPWGVRCTEQACTELQLSALGDSPVATAAAIGGTSSTDVWVVGRQLVKHFDGTAWTATDTSALGTITWSDVAAVAPDEVWAVGTEQTDGPPHTIAARWDGSAWVEDPAPIPEGCGEGAEPRVLVEDGVVRMSTTCDGRGTIFRRGQRGWVVELDTADQVLGLDLVDGRAWATGTSGAFTPMIWRLQRRTWTDAPAPSGLFGALTAMAGRSSADRWVVGATPIGPEPSWLVAHWDGTTWRHAPQAAGTTVPLLADVVLDQDRRPWAVGGETHGCPHPNCGDDSVLLRGPSSRKVVPSAS